MNSRSDIEEDELIAFEEPSNNIELTRTKSSSMHQNRSDLFSSFQLNQMPKKLNTDGSNNEAPNFNLNTKLFKQLGGSDS